MWDEVAPRLLRGETTPTDPETPMTQPKHLALVLVTLTALLGGCAMEAPTTSGDADGALSGRPYFELWQATNGDHYFHLSAANHEIILSSQGYDSRSAALSGVLSVLDNGENPDHYEVRTASNGQTYFVLKARNGRVIGTSELYSSASSARRGVAGVRRNVGEYLDFQANRTGARFDVFTGADGRFYFNLHAGNGEIVLSSQGYAQESSAYNGAFSVAENGLDPDQYEVLEASNGGYYFNLLASNGRVVGTSEVYASRGNAERAIDSVMDLCATVDIL